MGEFTGLPLSKFATAELVARARRAGFVNLWGYVEALENAVKDEGIWWQFQNAEPEAAWYAEQRRLRAATSPDPRAPAVHYPPPGEPPE